MSLTNMWNAAVAQGSSADWQFTLQHADGSPYDITGLVWEYVIRSPRGGTLAIQVTETASANGQITVTTTPASTVAVALHPDATADLPPGPYAHALWSQPGTEDAFLWFTGGLTVQAVPQP